MPFAAYIINCTLKVKYLTFEVQLLLMYPDSIF